MEQETDLVAAPCVQFAIHTSSYAVACRAAGCYKCYPDILHAIDDRVTWCRTGHAVIRVQRMLWYPLHKGQL